MKILFAGDEHPYSAYALKKVMNLAKNTWADVIFLTVCPDSVSQNGSPPLSPGHPLSETMHRWRETFMDFMGGTDSPYAEEWGSEWIPLKSGAWEEVKISRGTKKELKLRVRAGNTDTEILNESKKESADLIILGCGKGKQYDWENPAGVPQSVLSNAECSVLLVKEDKPVKRIRACIDEISVSQESLEMINQMATIHEAELELIGLTKEGGAKPEAYSRMIQLGDYYSDRGIPVKSRLAEMSEVESFISKETGDDLLAFWMGKKSLLTALFPRDWVQRFVNASQSSVLVLR